MTLDLDRRQLHRVKIRGSVVAVINARGHGHRSAKTRIAPTHTAMSDAKTLEEEAIADHHHLTATFVVLEIHLRDTAPTMAKQRRYT